MRKVDNFNQKIEICDGQKKLILQKLKVYKEFKKEAQDEIDFWLELIKAGEVSIITSVNMESHWD